MRIDDCALSRFCIPDSVAPFVDDLLDDKAFNFDIHH